MSQTRTDAAAASPDASATSHSGAAPESVAVRRPNHTYFTNAFEDNAFHLCSPKDTAQFIFGAFENAFLHRWQIFSRSIDVEIQQRHCGLIRCALAPLILFGGMFQRARDLARIF